MLMLSLFIQGDVQSHLKTTITVLMFCLPFVATLAFLAGLFDGHTRFRRVNTEILTKKIILGVIFIILSLMALVITQMYNLDSPSTVYLLIGIFGGCLVCNMFLGLLGASILNAKFPG